MCNTTVLQCVICITFIENQCHVFIPVQKREYVHLSTDMKPIATLPNKPKRN